ncbi:hypothetical protein LV779_37995 [Streptomyces thinghirensis]|nr:hypothetical protein [Streptomyces thinghirensis]
MRTRLSLRKEQVAASLSKHGAGRGYCARHPVLDASGSMSSSTQGRGHGRRGSGWPPSPRNGRRR